ncbi:MAG: hypothetical protein HKN08_04155 [Gammaproteobacteria bacterium]|nr:hypothetical protein [Gammaproteobacteria bacterium]
MRVNLQLIGDFQQNEQELMDYTSQKVSAALKNSRRHIKEVVVRVINTQNLANVRGKKCSVHLLIPGQNPIQVKKHADNILYAINSAIDIASYKTRIRTRQQAMLVA